MGAGKSREVCTEGTREGARRGEKRSAVRRGEESRGEGKREARGLDGLDSPARCY